MLLSNNSSKLSFDIPFAILIAIQNYLGNPLINSLIQKLQTTDTCNIKMQIHEESRNQIKFFEYQKLNSSLFASKILDPIAQTFLERIPEWLNPNVFTLLGLGSVFMSYCLSLLYSPSPLCFIVTALALLIYQLCDSLNQKTAIKNQSNSIVTILFDHLADHMVCCMIALTFCNLLEVSLTTEWMLFPLFSIFPFYLKYLNLYYVDKMVLAQINPVDEGVFLLQITCWVSAAAPTLWRTEVLLMSLGSWFIALAIILKFVFVVRTLLESESGNHEKFSVNNLAPLIATFYVALCYFSMNSSVLSISPITRLIEWQFILVHTLIIGRILVYHASGQRFKPISFGYLLLIMSNIVMCAGIWFIDTKDKIIICGMLALIIVVLVISYSAVWVTSTAHTLKQIVNG